jgi:hypothetical protein
MTYGAFKELNVTMDEYIRELILSILHNPLCGLVGYHYRTSVS